MPPNVFLLLSSSSHRAINPRALVLLPTSTHINHNRTYPIKTSIPKSNKFPSINTNPTNNSLNYNYNNRLLINTINLGCGARFIHTNNTIDQSIAPEVNTATNVSPVTPEIITPEVIEANVSNLTNTIPDPPEVPSVQVQELLSDTTITTTTPSIIYNSLGEPTLQSLGLASNWPPGLVQQSLEFLHVSLSLPWWASILTGTIIIRLLLFPLVIKSQKNAAKMQNNMPQMQLLQLKISEARQTGDAMMAAKYTNDLVVFMKEKEISPFKSMLVPMAMAPVFISFFFGLRKMANLPVESMREGGLLWFTDLTMQDPYYILPFITSATLWITLEIGADGVKMSTSPHGNIMKYVLRAIPIIVFPMTMNFPAALLCYWVSTNTVSLLQVSLLKVPSVREKFGIEKIVRVDPEALPIKNKGFMNSAKESWTNMKLTREMQDRERYDEIQFKRAGRGPLPKTFKYNPVQQQAQKLEAKSK